MEHSLFDGSENFPASLDMRSPFLSPIMRRALRGRRRVRNLSSFGVNTTILFGFVICLCATSHMYHLMDELLAEYARASITENKTTSIESSSKQSYVMSLNKKAKASMLKALIRQRGLPFINAIERQELIEIIKASGEITREEFVAAEKLAILDESSNNKKPDNYDYVILNKRKVLDRYSKVDHTSLTSMIFDTESLFIEQVEDNKDSVWLLAVVGEIDEFNSERPTFPPNVWGSLIKYLSGFGFRFGLLDCRLLKSICMDRGFIAADLVLALPRGDDRMKDSVQFRLHISSDNYFHRNLHNSSSYNHTLACSIMDELDTAFQSICDSIFDRFLIDVYSWLFGVLSDRVKPLNDLADILPHEARVLAPISPFWYNWLWSSLQPIHLIWISRTPSASQLHAVHSLVKKYPAFDILYHPPLSISALSVTYTGRVRFWRLKESGLPKLNTKVETNLDSYKANHPTISESFLAASDILYKLGCLTDSDFTQKLPDLVLLTPEYKCISYSKQTGAYLSYKNLEIFLLSLFPSVNDAFLACLYALNLAVVLGAIARAGSVFAKAYFIYHSFHNWHQRNISLNDAGATDDHNETTQNGWVSYTPAISLASDVAHQNTHFQSPADVSSSYRLGICPPARFFQIIIDWFVGICWDLFFVNFLLLLTILPVINAFSCHYATPIINLLLWILRIFSLYPTPLSYLRNSLLLGHLNRTRAIWTLLFFSLTTFVLSNILRRKKLKKQHSDQSSWWRSSFGPNDLSLWRSLSLRTANFISAISDHLPSTNSRDPLRPESTGHVLLPRIAPSMLGLGRNQDIIASQPLTTTTGVSSEGEADYSALQSHQVLQLRLRLLRRYAQQHQAYSAAESMSSLPFPRYQGPTPGDSALPVQDLHSFRSLDPIRADILPTHTACIYTWQCPGTANSDYLLASSPKLGSSTSSVSSVYLTSDFPRRCTSNDMPCAHKTRSSDSESYSARSIAPLYKPNITSGVTSALDSLPATLSTEPPPVQILTSVYSPPNLNPLPTVLTDESTAYLTSSSDLHAPFSYPNNSGFTMLGPPIRSDTLDPYDADSDDTDTQQLNTPDQLFSGGRPHFIRTSSRRRNSSLLARSRWGRHSARCTSFSSVLRNPTHDKDSSLSPSSSSSTSLLSYLSFSGSESNLGSNSQDPLVTPSSQNHELSTFVFSPNSLADTHETFPCVPAPPLAARPPDGSLFLDQLSTSIPESTVSSPACSAWPSWVVACEKCVVCWRQFRPATRLGALPCGHAFHETCIRRWLDTGALACPICRWPAHALHLRQLASLLAAIRPTSPEANPSSDHAF